MAGHLNDMCNVTITRAKENSENTTEKQDVIEAPEGGWGYVVVFAFSLIQFLLIGITNSLGILFNDLLNKTDSNQPSAFIFLTALNLGFSVSGVGSFLSGILLKRFTVRQTACFGTLFIFIGDFFSIFMTEPYHLFFTYGLLKGLGIGFVISLGYLTLNSYFVKKRTCMSSLIQTSICLGSITFPSLITLFVEEYGFRGSLILILGLDLNIFLGALLLVPAKPIIRSDKAATVGKKNLVGESSTNNENDESLKTLLSQSETNSAALKLNNVLNADAIKKEKRKASVWSRVVKYLNLNFLADPIFLNITMGLSLSFFSDGTFKLLEPLILYSYRFEKSQVATCITAGGIADFLATICMAVITLYVNTSPRPLFFIVLSLTFATKLVFLTSESYIFVTVMTFFIGILRSWMSILNPVIMGNYGAPDQFPATYGVLVLMTGVCMSIGGPIIGLIHTYTGRYTYVLYSLAFCTLLHIIMWMFEYFYTRKYKSFKLFNMKLTS